MRDYARQGLGALVVLLIALLVVRPMLKSLMSPAAPPQTVDAVLETMAERRTVIAGGELSEDRLSLGTSPAPEVPKIYEQKLVLAKAAVARTRSAWLSWSRTGSGAKDERGSQTRDSGAGARSDPADVARRSEAAEVLKHMGAKDVQKVGQAMATLTNVSRERATEVLENFVLELDTQTSLGVGAMTTCAACWSARSAKTRPTA